MASKNEAIDVENDDSQDLSTLKAEYESFLPKYGALWKSIAPKLPLASREPLSLLPAIENGQSVSLRVPQRCNECPWDSSCQGCRDPIIEIDERSPSSRSSSSDESVDTAPVRFDLSQLLLDDNDSKDKSDAKSSPIPKQEPEFIAKPQAQPFRDTVNEDSSSAASSSNEKSGKADANSDENEFDSSASSSGTDQMGWDLSFLRLEDDDAESTNKTAASDYKLESDEDSFAQESQQWLETRAKEKKAMSQTISLLDDSDSDDSVKATTTPVVTTRGNVHESRKPKNTVRAARVIIASDNDSSSEEEWDDTKADLDEESETTVPQATPCLSPTVIVLSDSENANDDDSWSFRSAKDDDDGEEDSFLDDSTEIPSRDTAAISNESTKGTHKGQSKKFFRKNRQEIGDMAFAEFDRKAFNGALVDVELVWSNKLRTTAGLTRLKQVSYGGKPTKRIATIELSTKIIDEELRLRATLLHEMCHAAAWLVDGVSKPPHGSCFKKWANTAMSNVSIDRCQRKLFFF